MRVNGSVDDLTIIINFYIGLLYFQLSYVEAMDEVLQMWLEWLMENIEFTCLKVSAAFGWAVI